MSIAEKMENALATAEMERSRAAMAEQQAKSRAASIVNAVMVTSLNESGRLGAKGVSVKQHQGGVLFYKGQSHLLVDADGQQARVREGTEHDDGIRWDGGSSRFFEDLEPLEDFVGDTLATWIRHGA